MDTTFMFSRLPHAPFAKVSHTAIYIRSLTLWCFFFYDYFVYIYTYFSCYIAMKGRISLHLITSLHQNTFYQTILHKTLIMSFDKFGLQIAQVSNLVFNFTLYQKKLIIFNVNLKDQGCSVHQNSFWSHFIQKEEKIRQNDEKIF